MKDDFNFLIYRAQNKDISVNVIVKDETIWLTQQQISEIFQVERSVITKHIRNILEDSELDEKSTCAKFAHVKQGEEQ